MIFYSNNLYSDKSPNYSRKMHFTKNYKAITIGLAILGGGAGLLYYFYNKFQNNRNNIKIISVNSQNIKAISLDQTTMTTAKKSWEILSEKKPTTSKESPILPVKPQKIYHDK